MTMSSVLGHFGGAAGRLAHDAHEAALRACLSAQWNKQAGGFSDLRVVACSGGGGRVALQSHLVVWASLMPWLRTTLEAVHAATDGEVVLVLPEVLSNSLESFLMKVYGVDDAQRDEPALVPEDLQGLCIKLAPPCTAGCKPDLVVKEEAFSAEFEDSMSSSARQCDSMELNEDNFEALEEHMPQDYLEMEYSENVLQEETPSKEGTKPASKRKTFENGYTKKSLAWNHFERLSKNSAQCKHCDTVIGTISGTTSGLFRHIKTIHPDEYENLQKNRDDKTELDKARAKKLVVLNFFEKGEEDVLCKECQFQIPLCDDLFDAAGEHLRVNHPGTYITFQKQYSESEAEVKIKSKKAKASIRRPRQISAIWQYFKQKKVSFQGDVVSDGTCLHCNKVLICKQRVTTNLIRHLERIHPEKYQEFVRVSQEERNRRRTQSPAPRTQKTNHGSSADQIEAREKKKRGPKHQHNSDSVAHRTCPVCKKVYSCRQAMNYHRRVVHSGVRPFKCDECGMTFARSDCFRAHTHSSNRPYLCSMCGKTFARKSIRDVHERSHFGDKRYPCSYCEKKFMTNQQRTNHERVHTGEKPYQCTHCGRQFAQQHQLSTHIRIHTGERPYSCATCPQTFRHLSSKNNHKCQYNRVQDEAEREELDASDSKTE